MVMQRFSNIDLPEIHDLNYAYYIVLIILC